MSKKSIKDFYEDILSDLELRKEIEEIENKNFIGKDMSLNSEERINCIEKYIIPFAKSKGYDFTIDEIITFEDETIRELSQEELKSIDAGLGVGVCFFLGIGVLALSSGTCLLLGGKLGGVICIAVG